MKSIHKVMKVILISYPSFFEGEAETVSSLMEKFDFTFHLRKPNARDDKYENFLNYIPQKFHSRIVLHQAWHLKDKYDIAGLHFSTVNRQKFLRYNQFVTVSTSCHSFAEIQDLDGQYNYMFLSPVFDSISKKGYKSLLDFEEIKKQLSIHRKSEIFALGGISQETLPCLINLNFDGIALLGAVWTASPSTGIDYFSNLRSIFECIN